jgi:outer membrane protein TolC
MNESKRPVPEPVPVPALVVAVLLALGAPTSRAHAQIDPDAAVAAALDANPTLRAAILERRRAEALVLGEEARYAFVFAADGTLNIGSTPTLSVGAAVIPYSEQIALGVELRRTFEWGTSIELRAQGSRVFRRTLFNPAVGVVSTGPGYAFDVTLTVTQPLLRGFGDRIGLAQLRAARVDRDRVVSQRDRTASELVRDTLVAYWELWYAQSAVGVERASRDLADAQLREARQRQELGALARHDVLSFATQLGAQEEAVVAAENDVRARSLELQRLFGGREPGDVDAEPPALPPGRDASIVERALETSPEIAELEAAVAAAEEQARTAGQALEPRLDIQGQLGVHGLGYDDVGQTFDMFARFAAVTGLVTLEFELPLDDTQHRMEVERAQLAIEAATQRLEAGRQRITSEVRRLAASESAARRRLDLASETETVARELVEVERERYRLGSSTAIAVTQAEDDLREAQLRVLRARVDLVNAHVQLSHLSGELLGSPLLSSAME